MKLRLKGNQTYTNNGHMFYIELKPGQYKLAKNLLGGMHQVEVDSDLGPVRISTDLLFDHNAVYQLRDLD